MAADRPFYILDASVILKWFLHHNEGNIQEAVAIKDDVVKKNIEVGIPEYALAEIANVLGYKVSHLDALSAVSYIFLLHILQYPVSLEMVSLGMDFIKQFSGISFYDAGYHVLALQHGGVFITDDRKYYQKTHKEGSIMLLKDYGKKR